MRTVGDDISNRWLDLESDLQMGNLLAEPGSATMSAYSLSQHAIPQSSAYGLGLLGRGLLIFLSLAVLGMVVMVWNLGIGISLMLLGISLLITAFYSEGARTRRPIGHPTLLVTGIFGFLVVAIASLVAGIDNI